MAIRENISENNIIFSDIFVISGDGTSSGTIIDTSEWDLGTGIYISAPIYTDGTYTVTLVEGDDSGLADGQTVPDDKLAVVDGLNAIDPGFSAVTVPGDKLFKVGVTSNKQYLRVDVNATAVTTGATVLTYILAKTENRPADIDQ